MEATVEVLTAEVRALMIGSRQVTLSVFRQLDEVNVLSEETCDAVEPFGRVRSGTRYPTYDMWDKAIRVEASDEFVGCRKSDGTLVRVVLLPGELRHSDDETKEIIGRWRDTLPLIVLAGLK